MAWAALAVVVLIGLWGLTVAQGDNLRPVINTSKGQVRGVRTFITNQQTPVDKFLGIPYAQPPTGQGRFRQPIEAQSWSDIKDTTEYSSACYHTFKNSGFKGDDMWNPRVPVSEDCLYLNVWTPRNIQRTMTKLTTLVWIYGGAFYSGSSDLPVYDGSYLAATHNAIVVSMNYRLGAFGFLNLGVPDASGNVGLQDQSLALKWTYQNIEAFGGDRTKITIFGESAGAASVSYHLLAQPSWDYFNTAIMQSANALSPWAFQSARESVENSKSFARQVGCTSENAEEIARCLRGKSVSELARFLKPVHLLPTVDGQFITKAPELLLRDKEFKRCNILLGFNSDEQTYFMSALYPEKFGHTLRQDPSLMLSEVRDLLDRVTLSPAPLLPNTTLAFENLLQVYVHQVPKMLRGPNYKVLDDITGDHEFKCPVIEFARAYAGENLGVYMYEFQHRSPTNPWPEWTGTMHGYEIEFVFGMPYNTSAGYSTEDKRIADVLMSYWVTFSTNGNPNSQKFGERHWPNFTESEQRYKLLKSDLLETKQYPRYAQCSFWRDFLPILENYSESTAEAMARCSGCRESIPILAILLMSILSVFITSKNG